MRNRTRCTRTPITKTGLKVHSSSNPFFTLLYTQIFTKICFFCCRCVALCMFKALNIVKFPFVFVNRHFLSFTLTFSFSEPVFKIFLRNATIFPAYFLQTNESSMHFPISSVMCIRIQLLLLWFGVGQTKELSHKFFVF